MVASPDVGVRSVASIRRVVVLPAPFGPRKPNISPEPMLRSTPRTASTSELRDLNVRRRSRVSIIGPLVGRADAMVLLLGVYAGSRLAVAPFSIVVQYLHRADNDPRQGAMSTMNRETIDSVVRSLRRVNLQGSFFGQTVAIRFGLSESDVEALELLLDTGAATAGRLSELMGLSTGAVTRVIDRLEQAGYVRRVPDAADRRRVVVELVPEKMEAMEATMASYGDKSAAEMKRYSDAELAVINDVLTRMADVTRDEANARRDAPEGEKGAPSEFAAPIGGRARA